MIGWVCVLWWSFIGVMSAGIGVRSFIGMFWLKVDFGFG